MDYDHELNFSDTSELYDYCTSQLPDIPHSDVYIVNGSSNSTGSTYHYCRVETERGVFVGSATIFDGMDYNKCICTIIALIEGMRNIK